MELIKKPTLFGLLLACVLGVHLTYAAEEPRVLGWSDLVPPVPAYDDPFLTLTSTQLSELGQVARYRERQHRGEQLQQESGRQLTELTHSLEEQGLDVDGLLARREEIKEKRRAAAEAVDASLNNLRVRIPGYLLPLEFSGTQVTEFLLVPTVGACIHVPPPPANQMVHVMFADGFEANSLYTPVWVEGTLTVGSGKADLFLKDGSTDIKFGYRISAVDVENYRD